MSMETLLEREFKFKFGVVDEVELHFIYTAIWKIQGADEDNRVELVNEKGETWTTDDDGIRLLDMFGKTGVEYTAVVKSKDENTVYWARDAFERRVQHIECYFGDDKNESS